MKKIYEGKNLYATLCYKVGQKVIKNYWADCVLSMAQIMKMLHCGEMKFIVVFRRNGAELFPCSKGVSIRFSFYKEEEPKASVFLLDYDADSVSSLSWEEAENILLTD